MKGSDKCLSVKIKQVALFHEESITCQESVFVSFFYARSVL